jgi:hypothetical protein
MESSKLKPVILSAEVALGVILLFFGSVFFYSGMHAYYDLLLFHTGRGTVQLIPLVTLWGGALIILGIYVAEHLGEQLKSRHLATISLAHLIAVSAIYLHLIRALNGGSYLILEFLGTALLNNALLYVAFLIGYFRKHRSHNMGAEKLDQI